MTRRLLSAPRPLVADSAHGRREKVPGLLLDVHAPQGALNPVFSSLQPRAVCYTNPVTVMQLRKTRTSPQIPSSVNTTGGL